MEISTVNRVFYIATGFPEGKIFCRSGSFLVLFSGFDNYSFTEIIRTQHILHVNPNTAFLFFGCLPHKNLYQITPCIPL